MKHRASALLILLVAAALIAGCTQSAAPATSPEPVITAQPTERTAAQPAVVLGDHYFEKKYSWQDGDEVYSEMFVVGQGQPWGIGYDVTPLTDDASKCWYEVTVIDMNNPSGAQSFGYGRSYSTEKNQAHPVYGFGSYKVEMRGNFVKVDMKAAKRIA